MITIGLRRAEPIEVAERIRGIGNARGTAWTSEGREIARRWVIGIARAFGDRASMRSVASAYSKHLKTCITSTAVTSLGFAGTTPPAMVSLKRAAACYFAYSVEDAASATRLLQAAGPDAERMMETVGNAGPWPTTWSSKVGRIRAALAKESW